MKRTKVIDHRYGAALLAVLLGMLLPLSAHAFGESGGSGLLRIEQAYSLPIGRPLVSVYTGFYSNDFTPGTSRLFSFTPSLTLGLGGGFEASGSLRYEGLSSSLDGDLFTHRYDVRRRTLLTKLRWTTDVGTPRLRAGLLGHLGIPAGEANRAGSTMSPDFDMDRGLMLMTSANLGAFSVPLRFHANVGYWWSRNDGAFYYRDHPFAIDLPGADGHRNDVLQYGFGLEAGLRRAVIFLELSTEQFIDARSSLSGRENLWRLTPGFRTQLTSTVGVTGGIAFDLSGNDPDTAYDPQGTYPDYELRLGLTVGSVLSRESHEARHYKVSTNGRLEPAPPAEPGSWMLLDHAPLAAGATPEIIVEPAAAPAAAATQPVPVVVPAAPPASAYTDETLLRELERRLDRIETMQRLTDVETRLARVENLGGARIETLRPAPVAAAPAPTGTVDTTATVPVDTTTVAATDSLPAAATQPLSALESAPATPADDAVQARMDQLLGQFEQALAQLSRAPQPVVAPAPAAETVVTPTVETVAAAPTETVTTQTAAQPAQAVPDPLPATPIPVPATPVPVQDVSQPTRSALAPIPATPQQGGSTTVVVTDPTPRAAAPAQFQPDVALDPELTQPYTYDVSQDAAPGLDPALLRPYAAAPTGRPATDAAPATTAFAPQQDVFPVAVGGRLAVKDVDLGLAEPFADPANRTALDAIAALLVRHPEVGVALLVHGVGSDRTAALSLSETQAAALRDYLVAAGANAAQIVPLGMGLAEAGSGASRLEMERLR